MLTCPFCSADLSETVVLASRCPVCGCALDRGEPGRDVPPLDAEGGREDESDSVRSLRATLENIVRQGEESTGAEGRTPDIVFHQPDAATRPTEVRGDATVDLPKSDARPEDAAVDVSRVTAMWQGMVTPRAEPRMTIKAASRAEGASEKSSLVVKPRAIGRPHEVDAENADYEILEMIGEGGMGVVYAARQGSIDRTVAVKMLNPQTEHDADMRHKFLSEAVVTGDLDHPNIVPIYDLGSNNAGALFYSMKRVVGTPWETVLGKKSLPENLEIWQKVADAVAFAHSRGIIHRDLKPENVMLGGFGEVLVMDWGLALSTSEFRKAASIRQSGSMGGTPAYMAPEMATGPLEKVGPPSDVYLLGAILYEIITGHPPHTGKNALECVHAAARNEIVPTEHAGELVDLARKAMATDVEARYADVPALQAALRLYQSHSESIVLARRAEQDLDEARHGDDYQVFSRALFAYQEALALWDGNTAARKGLSEAKREYAASALGKSDFDLGLSLLDEDDPTHSALRKELTAAQHERDARQQRLMRVRRTVVGLAASLLVIISGALVVTTLLYQQAQNLVRERDLANDGLTSANEELADEKRDAERARDDAKDSALEATFNAYLAFDAQQREELARRKQQYEAYIAQIGLSAAKIDENASQFAVDMLMQCDDSLRHWEWGRLMHLADQQHERFRAASRVEAVALDAAAARFATGGLGGIVEVWNTSGDGQPWSFTHGRHVHALAFSPSGEYLVTAGEDPDGVEVRIWDVERQTLHLEISGHGDERQSGTVFSVVFSADGRQLLTGSADGTARLWDAQTGAETARFHGHTSAVYCAAYSPDENRIATASEDRTVMIWQVDSPNGSWPPPTFTGHQAAVYAVAFSPDGKFVASGGADRSVLVWNPDELLPVDFQALAGADAPPATAPFAMLAGHTADVRSVRFRGDGARLVTGSHDNTLKIWDAESWGELAPAGQTLSPVKTLRGHTGWVRSCDYSRDGTLVLSGGYDGEAKLWNAESYEEVRVLGKPGPVAVLDAAFSDDGSKIVTAYQNGTAKTWDFHTGAPLRQLIEGHDFLTEVGLFFPDGAQILTAARDGTVRIWDVASGTQSGLLSGTGGISQHVVAALSADGRFILTGTDEPPDPRDSSDRVLAKLWDWRRGVVILQLTGRAADVTAVALLDNDRTLLTAHSDGQCRLYSADDGRLTGRLIGHTRKVSAVRYLPGMGRLLTASNDRTVAQWDLANHTELASLGFRHPDAVTSLDATPDGRLAITGCADGAARVWDVSSARVVAGPFELTGNITAVALDAEGRRGLTVSHETSAQRNERYVVRIWNLASGEEITRQRDGGAAGGFLEFSAREALLWSAAFSPDGRSVLTLGGKHARLWDIETGAQTRSFSPHGAVTFARFSQSAAQVVTGSRDNSAKIWPALAEQAAAREGALRKLEGLHRSDVNSAEFSANGQTILTAGNDGRAILWDVASGQMVRDFTGHGGAVRMAAFSPDGSQILTVCDDQRGRVWDVEGGEQPLVELIGHELAVLCGAYSADGRLVVTGSEDNTAIIWDAESGALLHTLEGHTASVTSVAFSPFASRVVTGSRDRTAKIWELGNRQEVLTLRAHAGEVTSVEFSPDGRTLLTASTDGTAVLWLTAEEGWAPSDLGEWLDAVRM